MCLDFAFGVGTECGSVIPDSVVENMLRVMCVGASMRGKLVGLEGAQIVRWRLALSYSDGKRFRSFILGF